MKIGLYTQLFGRATLQEILSKVKALGLDAIEVGTGNYVSNPHLDLEILNQPAKLNEYKQKVKDAGLIISALACHGNCLHPNPAIGAAHAETMRKSILLAEKLGVKRVVDFSGCPGTPDQSRYPNWVSTAWPNDYPELLKWQWEKKVIPFWKKRAKFAEDHGVKICLEIHPGFIVYSPETMLKLRAAVGKGVGANLDPSHLFWQGIDPCAAVRALGEAVYYVHAKDTRIYEMNSKVNGVLDTKPYSDERNRSWIFRTVGYGHGADFWADFVSTLQMVGYDDVISIEHEDSLMSVEEGLSKAVSFLKQVVIREKLKEIWWT